MSEDKTSLLEGKRVIINPDSGENMRNLRKTFEDLKKQFPYLSGIGFFGSRTRGLENESSDYDMVIFYDSSKITKVGEGGNEDWKLIKNQFEGQNELRLDDKLIKQGAGLRVDMNPKATRSRLSMFIEAAGPYLGSSVGIDDLLNGVGIPPTQDLYFRFITVIGSEVYQDRKLILDELDKKPNGDKYFEILMKCLAWFESKGQKLQLYQGYPKTIEEARKYFLTK